MKRDKLDKVFSNLVRERAGWACERCGTQYPQGKAPGLECAHIIGRAKKGVRFHPDNAVALCTGCHSHFTSRPNEFTEWQEAKFGCAFVAQLKERARPIYKGFKLDREEIYRNLKLYYAAMLAQRDAGMNIRNGRISFPSPYPQDMSVEREKVRAAA